MFVWLTIVTDRQFDRQTDHTTPSITIGRIYVVLQCSLKMKTEKAIYAFRHAHSLLKQVKQLYKLEKVYHSNSFSIQF